MLAMRVASDHPELVRALILGDNMIVTGQLRNPMYTSLFAGLRDLARGVAPSRRSPTASAKSRSHFRAAKLYGRRQ